ncbi:unnamed protein product [Phaeothamnion confervicola]
MIARCQEPACADKAEMFARMFGRSLRPKPSSQQAQQTTQQKQHTTAQSDATAGVAADAREEELYSGCPLDKDELGRATWGLLHTTAAHFPDEPSESHKQHALNLLKGLAHLYPCSYCAKDFQTSIQENPPRFVVTFLMQ